MKLWNDITPDMHFNQRRAVIAEERKRQRLIAENNKTFIEWVVQQEKQRGSKRKSINDARDRAHGRVVRATKSTGGTNQVGVHLLGSDARNVERPTGDKA